MHPNPGMVAEVQHLEDASDRWARVQKHDRLFAEAGAGIRQDRRDAKTVYEREAAEIQGGGGIT